MARYKSKGVWGKRIAVACKHCKTVNQYTPSVAKKKVYCSLICRDEANRIHPRIANCSHCKKDYKPKAGNRRTFCSRQCHEDHWIAIAKLKVKATVLKSHCGQCGKCYTKKKGSKYCSKDCRKEIARIKSDLSLRKKTICCRWCKVLFCRAYQHGSLFCSDDCKAASARSSKRRSKRLRSALIRGASEGIAVSAYSIFERDGWRCQGCGCHTPKSLRGTIEDDAPELDHIHPVSKGGKHKPNNLQCLCRLCNQMKSDRSMVDFINEINGIGGGRFPRLAAG